MEVGATGLIGAIAQSPAEMEVNGGSENAIIRARNMGDWSALEIRMKRNFAISLLVQVNKLTFIFYYLIFWFNRR